MSLFNFAEAIRKRPAGEQTSQLIAAYGNPRGPGSGPAKQRGWFTPSPTWVQQNAVLIPLERLPGFPTCPYGQIRGVTLHRLVAPVFEATWGELVKRGLNHRLRTFDGSAAYRHMGHDSSRPLSVHAFLAAVDLDAAWNGYGVPLAQMQIDRDVVRTFEECGWTWGGRWTGRYADGMHFQWTDPLSGVPLPSWQDAAAVAGPDPLGVPTTPLIVKPRPEPASPPEKWEQMWEPGINGQPPTPIPGLYASLRINKDTGERRIFRVPKNRLKERGLE